MIHKNYPKIQKLITDFEVVTTQVASNAGGGEECMKHAYNMVGSNIQLAKNWIGSLIWPDNKGGWTCFF